jgi:hypothetical protein
MEEATSRGYPDIFATDIQEYSPMCCCFVEVFPFFWISLFDNNSIKLLEQNFL